MLNQDRLKTEFDRVEETLAELTPQPETFGFSVYPVEDVWSDMKQLETFRRKIMRKNFYRYGGAR